MGCDIHMQVEVRGENGWHREPYRELPCDWSYCEGGTLSAATPNEKMRGAKCSGCRGAGVQVRAFWDDRHYDVFAILADVRNGYGFAGVDTGDGFVPIDTPRGLPDDLSPEIDEFLKLRGDGGDPSYREAVERILGPGWTSRTSDDGKYTWWTHPQDFWLGDHSFTYLTVAEILAYDWSRKSKKRGWVGVEQFEVFEREGRPSSWSGGISGQSIEHVSNQEMRRRISDGSATRDRTLGNVALKARSYYTLVEWEVVYSEVAEHFLDQLHKYVVPLGDPKDVRLVMGFDS